MNRKSIERIDRRAAQCCSGLYCTSAYYAAGVISKMIPLELSIHRRSALVCHVRGWSMPKNSPIILPSRVLEPSKFATALEDAVLAKWQDLYKRRSSLWTQRLLPSVYSCIAVNVSFFLGQALTAHRCFRAFLYKIQKVASPLCPYEDGSEETAEHVFLYCRRFEEGRPPRLVASEEAACLYMERVVRALWVEENDPQSITN